MNLKPSRKQLKKINKVYKSLGIDSEVIQRQALLTELCRKSMPKQPTTPTETGTNSNGRKGLESASLRS